MKGSYISLFDVIGPVMVGPSSSHTSGAAAIAWTARQIFTGTPGKVKFTLYGSFSETYKGHGTDRALIGGILGYKPDDLRIRDAYEEAEKAGLEASFVIDKETKTAHPNTVDVFMETETGHTLLIRGESVGGGRIRITKMNNIDVDFTGEYSTLIVGHRDERGMASFITSCLAMHDINIAFMKIFREGKGEKAITVIESDDVLPEQLKHELMSHEGIDSVDAIELL